MQAWNSFVDAQAAELGHDNAEKWLKTLKIVRYDACNLYLEAADVFQFKWFEEHVRHKVQDAFLNNNKRPIKVHLSLANQPLKEKKRAGKKSNQTQSAFSLTFDELDPNCIFKHFVVTKGNQLAEKVFQQLIDEVKVGSPTTYNPVYLHGGQGSGKTHLLMAAAHALRSQGSNAMYAKAQTFTDHVVSAIRAGEMSQFRQTYRNVDVLILDDVHIFSRKGSTQEEFFHTFNTLHIAGKQLILSANCTPGELTYIEPRLVSRFEWGIVLPLETHSRDEAATILKAKCKAFQFPLHDLLMEMLLDSFSTVKSLCRAVEALILRTHLRQREDRGMNKYMTPQLARQLLSDLIAEEERNRLTADGVVLKVAEHFGIKSEDLFGKSQKREYVLPRQISMYLCRMQLKMPFLKIADLFQKDHSTVMSSVKLIQKGIDADDEEIVAPYRIILKKMQN